MLQGMTLGQAIQQRAAVQSIGKKPRTQKYHREIVGMILRKWPGIDDVDVLAIAEPAVLEFIRSIEHLSATRFNAIVSMLKATVPAAARLKRRPVRVKDRPLLSQLSFSRLLDELDGRPQSHGGLVIRFLAHTGLRINEARQLKWQDVHEDFILAPGVITKNGRPRAIPFVNGVREVLEELHDVAGDRHLVLPQAECKRALNTACARAGVPHLSHHDFRHLFATRCVQSMVDLPTAARWLGHLDGGALLAKIYFHLVDEHSRLMAARVRI
jgi:integrase